MRITEEWRSNTITYFRNYMLHSYTVKIGRTIKYKEGYHGNNHAL